MLFFVVEDPAHHLLPAAMRIFLVAYPVFLRNFYPGLDSPCDMCVIGQPPGYQARGARGYL